MDKTPALIMAKIYKNFLKTQNHRFIKYGLRQQEIVFLLIILDSGGGISLSDITQMLDIDKSNTTRTVQSLEEKGLIVKENTGVKDPKYIIKLQEKGKTTAEEIKRAESESVSSFLGLLTDDEQAVLSKIIDKLLNA